MHIYTHRRNCCLTHKCGARLHAEPLSHWLTVILLNSHHRQDVAMHCQTKKLENGLLDHTGSFDDMQNNHYTKMR